MAIAGFSAWLETPQGQYVLGWEQARLDNLLADIFGFNAVQIGFPQVDFLRANRMPFRFYCCDHAGVAVKSDPHHLPFATNSLDLVVLPHVLEFDANPHQILREVDRVLVPEGSAVVTGFNPFSLWGVRRLIAGRHGPAPWQGRYISVPRLRDWFRCWATKRAPAPSAATRRPCCRNNGSPAGISWSRPAIAGGRSPVACMSCRQSSASRACAWSRRSGRTAWRARRHSP
jgi:SAM-dependent methyltransferase